VGAGVEMGGRIGIISIRVWLKGTALFNSLNGSRKQGWSPTRLGRTYVELSLGIELL
jgi:hypothetical protein